VDGSRWQWHLRAETQLEPGSPGAIVLGADGSALQVPSSASIGGPSASVTPLTVRTTATPTFLSVDHSAPSATSGAGIVGRVYANPTSAGQRLGYYLFGGDEAAVNTAGMCGWSAAAWSVGASAGSYLTLETTPIGAPRGASGCGSAVTPCCGWLTPRPRPRQRHRRAGYLFASGGALMWMGRPATLRRSRVREMVERDPYAGHPQARRQPILAAEILRLRDQRYRHELTLAMATRSP
jgi:hypothetical protein